MSKDLFFKQREAEINEIVNGVKEGNRKALTAYAELKQLADIAADAVKEVKDLALQETELYPDKKFELENFMFERRNGATRYSYSHIPKWQEKNKELKEIEAEAKQAYLASQKGMMVATEDGEEIVLPEPIYSSDSLIVKFKG
jgi:hypothetical protein